MTADKADYVNAWKRLKNNPKRRALAQRAQGHADPVATETVVVTYKVQGLSGERAFALVDNWACRLVQMYDEVVECEVRQSDGR